MKRQSPRSPGSKTLADSSEDDDMQIQESKKSRRLIIASDDDSDIDSRSKILSSSGKRTTRDPEHKQTLVRGKKLFKAEMQVLKVGAKCLSEEGHTESESTKKEKTTKKKHRRRLRAEAGSDIISPCIQRPRFIILNKKDLKPMLRVGDQVYSAWWPDAVARRANIDPEWFPGRITSVEEGNKCPGSYGPIRYYSIEFDDGDELDRVDDVYVFPKRDYTLSTRNGGKTEWTGVKNITDRQSADEWARYVGWWVATIDGQGHTFSLLSEALRAYDASVVRRKGTNTKPADLNLPEEWASFSDGKVHHGNRYF